MKYQSTRDITNQKVESAQAIKQGLASDGGLFVPEKFPKLTEEIYNYFEKNNGVEYIPFKSLEEICLYNTLSWEWSTAKRKTLSVVVSAYANKDVGQGHLLCPSSLWDTVFRAGGVLS